jgi:hypothetical protein
VIGMLPAGKPADANLPDDSRQDRIAAHQHATRPRVIFWSE